MIAASPARGTTAKSAAAASSTIRVRYVRGVRPSVRRVASDGGPLQNSFARGANHRDCFRTRRYDRTTDSPSTKYADTAASGSSVTGARHRARAQMWVSSGSPKASFSPKVRCGTKARSGSAICKATRCTSCWRTEEAANEDVDKAGGLDGFAAGTYGGSNAIVADRDGTVLMMQHGLRRHR